MIITTFLFVAIGIVLLSFWTARALTAPLRRFAENVQNFSLTASGGLLENRGPAEIRGVARALNNMHTRICHLVDQRTRTLIAIGHDLRSPITRMRLRVEVIKN